MFKNEFMIKIVRLILDYPLLTGDKLGYWGVVIWGWNVKEREADQAFLS